MTDDARHCCPRWRAIDELAGYDEVVSGLWRHRLDSYIALSATRMAQEQLDGAIAADVDIELASRLVVRLVETAVFDHVQHGAPRDDVRVAKALARAGWLVRYGRVPTELS
jgi:TetR/AcrR family transcriptional regulator, ethionamide resistance regulator